MVQYETKKEGQRMNQLALKDFIEYTYLSNLESNPSGTFATFTKTNANLEDNSYSSNIYQLNLASKQIRQLTALNKEKSAKWLNDTTVLFTSSRDKKIQELVEKGEPWTIFYQIGVDGGEATEAFRLKKTVTSFEVMSENRLALTVWEHHLDPDVHSMTPEEKTQYYKKFQEEKDYEVLDEIPFWSNGSGFTRSKRSRLYLYDIKQDELTLLSNETDHCYIVDCTETRILYLQEPMVGKRDLTKGLTEYDITTKTHTVLLDTSSYAVRTAKYFNAGILVNLTDMKAAGMNTNGDFYFYQDGNLSFLASHDLGLGNTVGSDCRYGGSTTLRIFENKAYFISTEDHDSYLKVLDASGTIQKATTFAGSVDDFIVTKDHTYVTAMHNNQLQELYEVTGEKLQPVSAFNQAILDGKYIADPELITFENNGVSFDGYVLRPKDYNPANSYPAILDIHGGPKTVYGTIFYHEMQVWANLGYFVFFTNPTGSDGRGNAFMDIRGKYGTVDYDDLMKFTDVVLDRFPQIDAKRLGVTGGSYGGFMTNWIIGHTDRFACAASQRSIANWISKFGTTDIGYYFNTDQQQADPWENVDKMWWHSPMKYADKVKTPTLFIHSEEDYRCWLVEGLQMFTSLKYHGVETRLCMFRKENHELSRSGQPKHRIRRLEEMTNWFEKYLK